MSDEFSIRIAEMQMRAAALQFAVQVASINASITGHQIGFIQSLQPHVHAFEDYIIKKTPLDSEGKPNATQKR